MFSPLLTLSVSCTLKVWFTIMFLSHRFYRLHLELCFIRTDENVAQSIWARRHPKPLATFENFSPSIDKVLLQLMVFISRDASMCICMYIQAMQMVMHCKCKLCQSFHLILGQLIFFLICTEYHRRMKNFSEEPDGL